MTAARRTAVLCLMGVAAACGDPGADTVFVKALPGRGGAASQQARPAVSGPEIRAFRGLYRREGVESRFQPCGTPQPLDVIGTAEGRALLAERFRWNSVWQGQPLYAVLRGGIVTDTLEAEGGDSTPRVLVRRFFVTGIDSMRAWDGDCGGMRVR